MENIDMREVMLKAQELAQAILASDIYQRSKAAEDAVTKDPDAARCMADYYEKEQNLRRVLDQGDDMDPMELADAGRELEEARAVMKALPLVQELQEANKACNDMLNNINTILRLNMDGETGCTGSCSTCGGCGGH